MNEPMSDFVRPMPALSTKPHNAAAANPTANLLPLRRRRGELSALAIIQQELMRLSDDDEEEEEEDQDVRREAALADADYAVASAAAELEAEMTLYAIEPRLRDPCAL